MHQWRNWQTRMIQVHMRRLVQVQVLSGAPSENIGPWGPVFLCLRGYVKMKETIRQVIAFIQEGS